MEGEGLGRGLQWSLSGKVSIDCPSGSGRGLALKYLQFSPGVSLSVTRSVGAHTQAAEAALLVEGSQKPQETEAESVWPGHGTRASLTLPDFSVPAVEGVPVLSQPHTPVPSLTVSTQLQDPSQGAESPSPAGRGCRPGS